MSRTQRAVPHWANTDFRYAVNGNFEQHLRHDLSVLRGQDGRVKTYLDWPARPYETCGVVVAGASTKRWAKRYTTHIERRAGQRDLQREIAYMREEMRAEEAERAAMEAEEDKWYAENWRTYETIDDAYDDYIEPDFDPEPHNDNFDPYDDLDYRHMYW